MKPKNLQKILEYPMLHHQVQSVKFVKKWLVKAIQLYLTTVIKLIHLEDIYVILVIEDLDFLEMMNMEFLGF